MVVRETRTSDLILRAAERLFAAKGFDKVRIREINQLAGQKNESALHYYFQSKEGLLTAIIRKHALPTGAATRELFEASGGADGHCTGSELTRMVIVPLMGLLKTADGRDYLRITAQFSESFPYRSVQGTHTVATDEFETVYSEILNLIVADLTSLPVHVRWERIAMLGDMMIFTLVRRAKEIENGETPTLTDAEFLGNLVAMSDASLHAPYDAEAS